MCVHRLATGGYLRPVAIFCSFLCPLCLCVSPSLRWQIRWITTVRSPSCVDDSGVDDSGVDDSGEDDSGVCPSQPKSSLSDLRISGVPSKTKKPRLEDLQAGLF